MPPPNSCPLGTSEYNLFWKQDLCRCNEVKMRSYWINTGVNPETDILIRRGSFAHRHTHTKDPLWQWRERDCQGTQRTASKEARREAWIRFSLRASRTTNLTNTLISVFLQTCERINFILLSHQFMKPCYSNPRKPIYTPQNTHFPPTCCRI